MFINLFILLIFYYQRSSRVSETAVVQLIQDCLGDVATSLDVDASSINPFASSSANISSTSNNSTSGEMDTSSSGGDGNNDVSTSVLRMGCVLCASCSGACCVATQADCSATTCCTTNTESGVNYYPDVDLPYIPPIYYPPYIPPIYYPPYIPPAAKRLD